MCTKKLCLYFSSIACGESLIGKASYSAWAVFVLNFPLKGNSCGFMGRIAPMAKITVLYKEDTQCYPYMTLSNENRMSNTKVTSRVNNMKKIVAVVFVMAQT